MSQQPATAPHTGAFFGTALLFLAITGVIGSFQVFSPVYVITKGGPLGATDVAVFHIYRRAFEEF